MQRYVPSECAEHAKLFTAYVHTSRLSQKTTGFIISWIGRLKSWENDPEGSGCCKYESDLVSRSTEAQPATFDLSTSEKYILCFVFSLWFISKFHLLPFQHGGQMLSASFSPWGQMLSVFKKMFSQENVCLIKYLVLHFRARLGVSLRGLTFIEQLAFGRGVDHVQFGNTSPGVGTNTQRSPSTAVAKSSSELKIKKVCDLEIESESQVFNSTAASSKR